MKKFENIMLIDDDEVEHFVFSRLVNETDLIENMIWFQYADEALEYLKTSDRPKIDAIFLDINMPRMDGFEFLEAATEQLVGSFNKKNIVIMLTTSMAPQDQIRAQQFDVIKSYINKPLRPEHISHILDKITSEMN